MLVYSAIASLDGYVADADGRFDWSAPDEEVHAFVNDLERPVGTFLLGRRMYEVLSVWETMDDPAPVMRDFAQIWRAADKVVYSRTLGEPSTARTRIEREFDPEAVRRMDGELSIGGAELAGQAIRAGLVRRAAPVRLAGRGGRRHGGASGRRPLGPGARRGAPLRQRRRLPALPLGVARSSRGTGRASTAAPSAADRGRRARARPPAGRAGAAGGSSSTSVSARRSPPSTTASRSARCGSSTRAATSAAASSATRACSPRRRSKRRWLDPPARWRPCTLRLPTLESTSRRPANTPAAWPPRRTSSTPTTRSRAACSSSGPGSKPSRTPLAASGGNGGSHSSTVAPWNVTRPGASSVRATGPFSSAQRSSQRPSRSGGTS